MLEVCRIFQFCVRAQVAGRLHVEVVRVGGGLEDNMAGGDETDNNQDAEFEDRKLVCMVSREAAARGKRSAKLMRKQQQLFKGACRKCRKSEDGQIEELYLV